MTDTSDLGRAHAPVPGVPTIAVPCPVCLAPPRVQCSAPADNPAGRRSATWVHFSRVPRETYPSRYRYGKADEFDGFGPEL
jgi:hypothetical protein